MRNEFEGTKYNNPSPIDTFGFTWGKWNCFWVLIGYTFALRFISLCILKLSTRAIE